jgi:wyosine [tRNA(Phe)-imidazoG37] synthetase (radical SAM superfamily)
MDTQEHIESMPPLDAVINEVETALQSDTEFAYITFSGNGEPTLYPWFAELVDIIAGLRDNLRPDAKIALLSNSTGLASEGVREAIPKIDNPYFKLDAGTEAVWRKVNRPAKGVHFMDITGALLELDDIYIQSVLIDGDPSNVTENELSAYFDLIRRIRPLEIQLYSIDRPVPRSRIEWIPPETLQAIARRGEKETGVKMRAYYAG